MTELALNRHEQHIRFQPVRIVFAKFVKGVLRRSCGCFRKRGERFLQNKPALSPLRAVINVTSWQNSEGFEIGFLEPPFVLKIVEINQVRVTRESRKTLVRRVAVTGRPQRANLPILHADISKKIDKPARLAPKCADPTISRQRSGM